MNPFCIVSSGGYKLMTMADMADTADSSTVSNRRRHRGHLRQTSAPSAFLQMSELERQWSSNHIFESFSTMEDNAAMSWANGSTMMTSDNNLPPFKNSTDLTSVATAPDVQFVQRTDQENEISSAMHDEARITNWTRVLQLCESHPELAQYVAPDGWTALHHACSRRCDRIDVMEELVRAYPEALLITEEKDRTPLHYAGRFKAPRDAVQLLLDLYPTRGQQAVSMLDKSGRTPLWYAVRYDAPPGVTEMLLSVDSTMVLLEDKTGESPLSLVWDTWAEKMDGKKTLQAFLQAEQASPKEMKGKLKKSWENANKLLQAAYPSAPFRILHVTSSIVCHRSLFLMAKALYPETAREVDSLGQNALHLAAASSSIEENSKFVILSLLGLYPEAAQISDEKDGSLPLHVAAANPAKSQWDADGVSDIYDAYPYAINVVDKNARLPLHHAAASSKIVRAENTMASDSSLDASQSEETSILMSLIHRFPRAATSSDLLGFLPMHYFVKHQTEWKEEANALYEANQGALTVRGGERQHLPLHLALSNPNPNRTIITKLVELHPRAAMQANKDGQLPLHIACETDKDWINGGVESVYQAYTQGIRTREANERGWYPLQIASASSKAPLSLIHQLARHFPEAARQRDNDDRLALHLVCEAGKAWCNGVKEVFRAHPLANVSEDKDGMLPFHRAALNFASVSQSCRREVDDNTTQLKDEDPSALSEEEQVEVLFELLRAHPIIVQ